MNQNNEFENIGLSERMARSKEFTDIIEQNGLYGENLTNDQIIAELDVLRESGKHIPVTSEETVIRAKWEKEGTPNDLLKKSNFAEKEVIELSPEGKEIEQLREYLHKKGIDNVGGYTLEELRRFKKNLPDQDHNDTIAA